MSTTPIQGLKHTPNDLDIQQDKPFANDAFGREPQADELTNFISSFAGHSFVLGINGVWGSGKTTFINMWEAKLKLKGFCTLRFNAWEHDHSEDPFASVFSEFRSLADVGEGESKNGLANLYKSAKSKAVPILAKAATGIIKHATLGALDLNADAEAAFGELAEASAKYALEKAESDKKSIKAFRDELAQFVGKAGTSEKPIVYFIDELDRCRPTYAVSVLERVKHLLNVPGVFFVFAWDRNQLNETIKHVYGRQTDSGGYLLRFVDLEFNLAMTNHRYFCDTLMNRFELREYLNRERSSILANSIVDAFSKIAENLRLSIREQEKAFTALSVIIRTGFQMDARVLEPLIILIMLRINKPKIYQTICGLPKNSSEAVNILRKLVGTDLPSVLGRLYCQSDEGRQLEGFLLHLLPEEVRVSMPAEYAYLTNKQSQNVLPQREENVKEAYRFSRSNRDVGGILARFINKMEFSERFIS